MTIRRLAAEEWDRLTPIFKQEFNELPPSPQSAAVVVAEENGEIAGMLVMQLLMHAEPLWVRETSRGAYLIPAMIREAHKTLPDVGYCFSFVKHERMARFLEKLGFKRLPWFALRWMKG